MNLLATLASLVLADFRERFRRFSTIVTLSVTIYAAQLFVPPRGASYLSISVGHFRGEYGTAWVASSLAVMASLVIGLFGFYLIKEAIQLDRTTRVGQIIAATPLRPWAYLLGKALSNFSYLAVMVGLVFLAVIPIQLLRGEVQQLDLIEALTPFLLITFPVMAVVAALGVLFESVRWLRGAAGNVLYFFLWGIGSVLGRASPGEAGALDLMGFSPFFRSIAKACLAAFPDCRDSVDQFAAAIQSMPPGTEVRIFPWSGIPWEIVGVGERLLWIAIALGIVGLAALSFGSYETAFAGGQEAAGRQNRGVLNLPLPWAHSLPMIELRLMMTGITRWWLLGAVGLAIVGLLSPPAVARAWILPLTWIWPLPLWSSMGCREFIWRTDRILFATQRPIGRQLLACWTAGVLLAGLAGLGSAISLALAADVAGLLGWVAGMLFIPSLALAAGVWSNTPRLFEVLYLIIWYLGPIEKFGPLDFLGAAPGGRPDLYLILAGGFVALAMVGRRRAVYA